MGRRRARYLKVGMRRDRGAFRLRWGRPPDQVHLTLPRTLTADEAEHRRREIQAALDTGTWPAWALRTPKVRAYAAGHRQTVRARDAGGLLEAYQQHLEAAGVASDNWRTTCLAFLRELAAFAADRGEQDLARVTPATAQAWIDSIPGSTPPFLQRRQKGRSTATANRALGACRKAFRWFVDFQGLSANPFANVAELAEEDIERIVYLTREQRDLVLAEASGGPDGLAVWIALYAGLRRKEIALLTWDRVRLAAKVRKLVIRNTKTPARRKRKARREVDIATPLYQKLRQIAPARRQGRVIDWPEEEARWQYRADALLDRIRGQLLDRATKKSEREWIEQKTKWNVFRHTFCTLHLQAGTHPNRIIGWTGHSMDVFLTHYGEFAPDFDPSIDAVDEAPQPKLKRKAMKRKGA